MDRNTWVRRRAGRRGDRIRRRTAPVGSSCCPRGGPRIIDLTTPAVGREPTRPDKGLRVEVLGPVRVRLPDGSELPLPRGRARLLLALLAISGGPVSRDQLYAELWTAALPKDPRHALENHVSRLRAVFDENGVPLTLALGPGGYELAPVSTDAKDLERAVTQGLAAAAEDVARADDILSRAEALWRGAPFGGEVDGPALAAEARRLVSVRRRLRDARFDAAIAAGRCDDVIDALRSDVTDDPLDERRRGQLMLALHRSGRSAEALVSYHDGVDRLATELGADAGPGLRRLHAQILRHAAARLGA